MCWTQPSQSPLNEEHGAATQSLWLSEPAGEVRPVAHDRHDSAVDADAYRPAWHVRQLVAPVFDWYRPPPKVPALQPMHELSPALSWYWPAAQSRHEPLPVLAL